MVERGKDGGRGRSGGPGIAPILGIIAVAAVAVVAGRMIAGGRDVPAPEEPVAAQDPFGDWPREQGREPSPVPGAQADSEADLPIWSRPANRAEASSSPLWHEPLWQRALEIAERGSGLAAEAVNALRSGDPTTYQEKGKEAKALIDEAITMTAEWEAALLEDPGEGDPGVRAIKKERSAWFDKLRVLHKTTGR
jgi:hypothetical protein